MTSLLLGQNANPNSKGLANTSPLIYAINEDEPNFEIVKLLIDAGADVIASETSKFCDSKWIVRDRSIAGRKWCGSRTSERSSSSFVSKWGTSFLSCVRW
ncbi:ankyrin repeat domain-containing protein [Leptospira kirschneri]|uniref:ankyrin repeat domain-containing protein n=1 Tax=Leptospira kirschneri TaxID=29507 RepID=UPI000990C71D|nr:ankyrin repeat domain-containing protein [Leptospira kirschneri]